MIPRNDLSLLNRAEQFGWQIKQTLWEMVQIASSSALVYGLTHPETYCTKQTTVKLTKSFAAWQTAATIQIQAAQNIQITMQGFSASNE
jgi:hypothetical protein